MAGTPMEVGRDDCDIMCLHLVCIDLTHTTQIPHLLRSSNSQTPTWSPIDESEQDGACFPLPREENLVSSHFISQLCSMSKLAATGGLVMLAV